MSRVGNKIIEVPSGVTVTVEGEKILVKGPKGELSMNLNPKLTIKQENGEITVSRPDNSIQMRQIHGTTRAILQNLITGVNEEFSKKLEIVGVGYRAQVQGSKLNLQLGFSHPVDVEIPKGLSVECPKNTEIVIKGANKELVGEFAANVRALKKPEPYKGKGIRYEGEHVRQKAGKTAK